MRISPLSGSTGISNTIPTFLIATSNFLIARIGQISGLGLKVEIPRETFQVLLHLRRRLDDKWLLFTQLTPSEMPKNGFS